VCLSSTCGGVTHRVSEGQEYAEALDSGSKRAGVDAGVPRKSGKK